LQSTNGDVAQQQLDAAAERLSTAVWLGDAAAVDADEDADDAMDDELRTRLNDFVHDQLRQNHTAFCADQNVHRIRQAISRF
jgi:hypothetical protein